LRQGRFAEAAELMAPLVNGPGLGTIEPRFRVSTMGWLGAAYRALGQPHDALRWHREAVSIAERHGALVSECDARTELAATLHAISDHAGAQGQYRHALKIARQLNLDQRIAQITHSMAAFDGAPGCLAGS